MKASSGPKEVLLPHTSNANSHPGIAGGLPREIKSSDGKVEIDVNGAGVITVSVEGASPMILAADGLTVMSSNRGKNGGFIAVQIPELAAEIKRSTKYAFECGDFDTPKFLAEQFQTTSPTKDLPLQKDPQKGIKGVTF